MVFGTGRLSPADTRCHPLPGFKADGDLSWGVRTHGCGRGSGGVQGELLGQDSRVTGGATIAACRQSSPRTRTGGSWLRFSHRLPARD